VTHAGCDKVGRLSDDSNCGGDVMDDRVGGLYDAVDGDSGWAGIAGDRVGRLSDEAAGDSDMRVVGTGSVTGDRIGGSHDVVGRRKHRTERRVDAGQFPTIVGNRPAG